MSDIGYDIHSTSCQAAAIIAAVENFRDQEVHSDGPTRRLNVDEFRARIASDLLAEADGYLADGTMSCTCHVAPIRHVKEVWARHPGDTAADRADRVRRAQELADAYVQNRQITTQDYIHLVRFTEGRTS